MSAANDLGDKIQSNSMDFLAFGLPRSDESQSNPTRQLGLPCFPSRMTLSQRFLLDMRNDRSEFGGISACILHLTGDGESRRERAQGAGLARIQRI
jgi:hypothetical protein